MYIYMNKHIKNNIIFFQKLSKHKCQANLHDLIFVMEKDKHLKRSTLRYKVLDKLSERID
jgi:hypothetical protein